MGDQEWLAEALGAYVKKRPDEMEAAQEYADLAANGAYQVVASDPTTSPSKERLKKVGNQAAVALWQAVQNRPHVPENYGKLIELYRMLGDEEKARKVPLYLSQETTATADDVHLAAYLLATNGYPQESIPLYERALKMDPNKARYRLNYAGALTRLGRFSEAELIYSDIIKNGVNGKMFHPHEVLANSIRLGDEHGYATRHFEFLKSLIPKKSEVAQHDLFLLETGKTYLALHQMDKAEPFFTALQDQYPEHRETAADMLIQTRVARGDFAGAEKSLATEEKNSTSSEGMIVLRLNLAEVKRMQGKLDDAAAIWSALPREFPKNRKAARALVTAAQALIDGGKFGQAKSLLNQYIALDVGDPDGESSARELLMKLTKLDVPDQAILQSAINDAVTSPPSVN